MSIPKRLNTARTRREFGVPCITAAPKPKGRPVGTIATGLREKAWRSMRHLRQFTLNDLLDSKASAPCYDLKEAPVYVPEAGPVIRRGALDFKRHASVGHQC